MKFSTTGPSIATKRTADNKPRAILPHDFLLSLHGRRVVVFLSYQQHELEGRLAAVDADKGDVLLEDVVHYKWNGNHKGDGSRAEVRRCRSAMVNSRYVEMISPA